MGAFKPLLPFAGSTVVQSVVARLRGAGVESIALVTGREAERLSAALGGEGLTLVHNPRFAETDMFASAKLGMQSLPSRCEAFFFQPVDLPMIDTATYRALLQYGAAHDVGVVYPVHLGQRGHPALIKASVCSEIFAYTGPDGLRGALGAAECCAAEVPLADPGILLDADRPEEYELLCLLHRALTGKDAQARRRRAMLAAALGWLLNQKGLGLDLPLIEQAALLFPGGPGLCTERVQELEALGLHAHADLLRRQSAPEPQDTAALTEASVLLLASEMPLQPSGPEKPPGPAQNAPPAGPAADARAAACEAICRLCAKTLGARPTPELLLHTWNDMYAS